MFFKNISYIFKVAVLFTVITNVFLVLSLWFGAGWFALGFFGTRVIMYIPEIFIPFLKLLFGEDVAKEQEKKYEGRKSLWVNRGFGILFLLLIVIVFWKYNIPLLELGN